MLTGWTSDVRAGTERQTPATQSLIARCYEWLTTDSDYYSSHTVHTPRTTIYCGFAVKVKLKVKLGYIVVRSKA